MMLKPGLFASLVRWGVPEEHAETISAQTAQPETFPTLKDVFVRAVLKKQFEVNDLVVLCETLGIDPYGMVLGPVIKDHLLHWGLAETDSEHISSKLALPETFSTVKDVVQRALRRGHPE